MQGNALNPVDYSKLTKVYFSGNSPESFGAHSKPMETQNSSSQFTNSNLRNIKRKLVTKSPKANNYPFASVNAPKRTDRVKLASNAKPRKVNKYPF